MHITQKDLLISILETTAEDGKNYKTKFYNLDAIIAVGYRVNSSRATQFRIWATQTLEEKEIKKLERTVSGFFDYIEEYEQFNKTQKIDSDFEKEFKKILKK